MHCYIFYRILHQNITFVSLQVLAFDISAGIILEHHREDSLVDLRVSSLARSGFLCLFQTEAAQVMMNPGKDDPATLIIEKNQSMCRLQVSKKYYHNGGRI
jgi:hypothetical protein